MREIKFRAFLENKHMVYYDFLLTGNVKRFAVDEWNIDKLMQFTGLKDSRGQEVYEGDVIEWLDEQRYEIQWVQEMVGFQPVLIGGEANKYNPIYDLSDVEVVGNIYENKDLV